MIDDEKIIRELEKSKEQLYAVNGHIAVAISPKEVRNYYFRGWDVGRKSDLLYDGDDWEDEGISLISREIADCNVDLLEKILR